MNSSKMRDALKKYEGKRIKASGDDKPDQFFVDKGHFYYLPLETAVVCEQMSSDLVKVPIEEESILPRTRGKSLDPAQMRSILERKKGLITTDGKFSKRKRYKVFVASSKEAKPQAELVIKELRHTSVCFIPWWVSIRPGHMFLSEFAALTKRVDAALFLFTPDIRGIRDRDRKKRMNFPNQNVLFELGYFWKARGPKKIALISYQKTAVPSDLDGWTLIPENKPFQFPKPTPPSAKTRAVFREWVATLRSKRPPKAKS